jgi:hypothetical protein
MRRLYQLSLANEIFLVMAADNSANRASSRSCSRTRTRARGSASATAKSTNATHPAAAHHLIDRRTSAHGHWRHLSLTRGLLQISNG